MKLQFRANRAWRLLFFLLASMAAGRSECYRLLGDSAWDLTWTLVSFVMGLIFIWLSEPEPEPGGRP